MDKNRSTLTAVLSRDLLQWKIQVRNHTGHWLVSYGFAYVPNKDENYFTEDAGAGDFMIREEINRKIADFVPSVYFSYLPAKWESRYVSVSLGAGVGFDLDAPVVMVGPMLTIRHNLTFAVGMAIHSQKRLLGRYEVGQKIRENLDSTQLHQETFNTNAFFAVSFRFGSNPFIQ